MFQCDVLCRSMLQCVALYVVLQSIAMCVAPADEDSWPSIGREVLMLGA